MPDCLVLLVTIKEVLAIGLQPLACLPLGAGASNLDVTPMPAISKGVLAGQLIVPNRLTTLLEVRLVVLISLVALAAPKAP